MQLYKSSIPRQQPMHLRTCHHLASTYLLLSASRFSIAACQPKTCPSDFTANTRSSMTSATTKATAEDAMKQNQPGGQPLGGNAGKELSLCSCIFVCAI